MECDGSIIADNQWYYIRDRRQYNKTAKSHARCQSEKLETLKKASEQAAKIKDTYDAWKAKYALWIRNDEQTL